MTAQKADQFARHRDDRDLWPLPIAQMREALMESVLGLPGVRDERRGLARLPALQLRARRWSMAIAPRRLH
jgi:hypothetical protein